jgi:methyl-accepting chemotaxis protein
MTQPAQQPATVADSLTTVPPPAPIQVGSNGSSGGYKFDPDQVQGVITQWQKLLDDLKDDVKHATRVADVKAPGLEFASSDFIKQAAAPSGNTLLEQHRRMVQYVQNYIEALQKASGQIQQSEDDAQQAAGQQGQGVL